MLKIKDSVNLKELEKYGFIKIKKGMTTFVPEVKYWYTLNNSEYDCVTILKDRHIFWGIGCYGDTHDIIYDLIEAGLVEKADDK